MAEKLLVVEDDPDYRALLTRNLLRAGFDFEAVGTITEAIECLRKSLFDGMLLDVGLPDVNPDAVVRKIKDHYPDVAIVVLSGNRDPKFIEQTIARNASAYLLKDIDDQSPKALAQEIRKGFALHKYARSVGRLIEQEQSE